MGKPALRRLKLTDSVIRKLPPQDRMLTYWDELQNSLGLLVTPAGTKSFRVTYSYHGQTRWYTIGRYPDISLPDARKIAQKIRARATLGEDPQGEKVKARKEAKAQRLAARRVITLAAIPQLVEWNANSVHNFIGQRAITFEAAHKLYVEECAKKKNKAWDQAEALIRNRALPAFGKKPIASVTDADVWELFDHVTNEEGYPMVANTLLASISAVFRWAMTPRGKDRTRLCTSNPTDGITRNKPNKRSRVLTDDEIKLAWPKLPELGLNGCMVARLILLTGQRPGEVKRIHWQHLNLSEKTWFLPGQPDGLWKGTKNGRDHVVALSDAALDVLDEIGPEASGLVFKTRGGIMASPSFDSICAEVEINRFRPHDLRRTCSSGLARFGASDETIHRMLNHTDGPLTETYILYTRLTPMRNGLDAWGNHVMALVEGRTAPSNVVSMAEARS